MTWRQTKTLLHVITFLTKCVGGISLREVFLIQKEHEMKSLFIFALGAIAATVILVQKPAVHVRLSEKKKGIAKLMLVASGGQPTNRS